MAVLTIHDTDERIELLTPLIGHELRGIGVIKKVTHDPRGHVFFVVEDITAHVGGRTFQIDHLNLARFTWHEFPTDFLQVGQRVFFCGFVGQYTKNGSRRFNAVGVPRLRYAEPA